MVNTLKSFSPLGLNPFGRRVIAGFGICAGLIWALNSERAIDFLFGFGDEPAAYYDPAGFPLKAERSVGIGEWQDIALPAEIKQASGLSVQGDTIAIATDMATVHHGHIMEAPQPNVALTADVTLLNRPLMLRQGYLEAATLGDADGVVYAVGGGDQLYKLRVSGDRIDIQSKVTLEFPAGQNGIPEILAVALNAQSGTLYVGYSPVPDQGIAIAEYAKSGKFLRQVPLSLPDAGPAELEQLLQQANVTGIAISGDTLVVLSDRHSGLLWADLNSGEIQRVWTLEGLSTLSAIALDNGRLYLMQDHEYYQPAPPLRALDVPHLQASQS